MKRTIAPTLVALGLVAAACSSDSGGAQVIEQGDSPSSSEATSVPSTDGDEPSEVGEPIGFAPAALQRFDECQAFLAHVRREGAERVGPYGFGDNGWFGPIDMVVSEMEPMDDMAVTTEAMEEPASFDDAASSDGTTNASSAPIAEASGADLEAGEGGDGTFSPTNVQVDGVDEPDIVKSDGDRILALSGDTLHYVDISEDGTDGTKRGSISLADTDPEDSFLYSFGHEILVSGDRAFVIAQGEGGFVGPYIDEPILLDDGAIDDEVDDGVDDEVVDVQIDEGAVDAEAGFAEPAVVAPIPSEPFPPVGGYPGPSTLVIEVDLSNPDDLRITNTMTMEGRYVNARAIGDTARVVVTSPPQDLGFLYPSNPNATDAATAANRELISNSTLEDWIPTYSLTTADGQTSGGDLVSCSDIHAPSEFAGFDVLSIVTVDLGRSLVAPQATSAVMASGDTVYASADRMYVSTNVWLPPTIDEQERGRWEEQYETAIHRFSIAGDGPAAYEASGSVDGHLLNQFSMHDRDGTFYVATTTGTPWSGDGSVSQIVAMRADGDRLVEVGTIGGLGETEQIHSVRYVDDVAYVVTFRQTDPFYVVDIADPTNMSVRGELKIPGYSSYLHPITDGLVLGVGQDADADGRTTGTKVSLFDVSDPAAPREIDVWTMPNAGSDVEFDHRAFLYWAPTGTAVLPLTNWADQYSEAVVLNVSGDGIVEQGRITHVDDSTEEIGVTDCEVVTGEGLTEADGDLFWISREVGSQLQLCGADDIGGASGFSYCDTIPVDGIDDWFWTGESGRTFAEVTGTDLAGVDRVEWCWSNGIDWQKQISRTMVVDGQIWSLSASRLQANDIGSLATADVVDL